MELLDFSIPTVCVANVVDTLGMYLAGRDARIGNSGGVRDLIAEQDQTLLWPPLRKLVVTATPIAALHRLREVFGLGDIETVVPRWASGELCRDLLHDTEALAKVATYAGVGRVLQLYAHTTTPALREVARVLVSVYGLSVHCPEAPPQALRDELDRKSGFRRFVDRYGEAAGLRMPTGWVCGDVVEAVKRCGELAASGRSAVIKADRGEACMGITVVPPTWSTAEVRHQLDTDGSYDGEEIVVEALIEGAGRRFPSVEYIVPPSDSPHAVTLTHACDMLFDGVRTLVGNVTGPEFYQANPHAELIRMGHTVAELIRACGYVGHFGIDAVSDEKGRAYMLELNARRTGSTHVHDFGQHILGPDYRDRFFVGNYVWQVARPLRTIEQVTETFCNCIPATSDNEGAVPCEFTGLPNGRLGGLIYAATLERFHTLADAIRASLRSP